MKRLYGLIISLLFILTLFLFPSYSSEGTRADFSVTALSDDEPSVYIPYLASSVNSDNEIRLQGNSLIQTASIDIEGLPNKIPTGPSTFADFSSTTGKKAYYGTGSNDPPTNDPSTLSGSMSAFSAGDHTSVSTDNGVYKTTSSSGTNLAYHLFEFDLVRADTSYIKVEWNGQGFDDYYYTEKATMYFYDFIASDWTQASTGTANYNSEITLAGNSTGSKHISSSNKFYVLVGGPKGIGGWESNDIQTDYISIESFVWTESDPIDPSLDLNDDGSKEWTYSGALTGKETFSGAAFVSALQSLVDGKDGGVFVKLAFEVQSVGYLYVSNITITYKFNTKPSIISAPGNKEINEDSGSNDVGLDLSDIFDDENGFENLIFAVHGTSAETVQSEITVDDRVLFTPASNWYGTIKINLSATDWGVDDIPGNADDVVVHTTNFNLKVFPTDDAPFVVDVGGETVVDRAVSFTGAKAANEDEYFNLTVTADDIDGDEVEFFYNGEDKKLEIDEETGELSYFPENEDVGTHTFQIDVVEVNKTVTTKLGNHVNITIEVKNTNDLPVLTEVDVKGDKVYSVKKDTYTHIRVLEDTTSDWTLDFHDDDGDTVAYSTNFTNPRFSLDSSKGTCSFSPLQEDVGTHWMGITLDDGNTGKKTFLIKLVVANVNDPPTMGSFTYTAGENPKEITFKADEGDDVDGDMLIYLWNFGEGGTGEGIEVTYTYFNGNATYDVELTVSDGTEEVSTIIPVFVAEPVVPVTDDDDDDDDEPVDNTTDGDDLPDSWEQKWFKGLDETPEGDYDSDGVSNYQEWKDNTDPTDPSDFKEEIVTDDDDDDDDKTNSMGFVIAGVVGAIVLVLVIVIIVALVVVKGKKKSKDELPPSDQPAQPAQPAQPDPYGQQPVQPDPYGQQSSQPYGQQPAQPYGQAQPAQPDPYGQQQVQADPYGQQSYPQPARQDPYAQPVQQSYQQPVQQDPYAQPVQQSYQQPVQQDPYGQQPVQQSYGQQPSQLDPYGQQPVQQSYGQQLQPPPSAAPQQQLQAPPDYSDQILLPPE